ncbi:hypothetical protein ACLBXM_22450 [Xanthobacteraceae bacterium A53D]
MRTAVERLFRQEVDTYNSRVQAENAKGGSIVYQERAYPVLGDMKKVDCVPSSKDKGGYICYYQLTLDGALVKRPGRFYVEQGTWTYAHL